MAGLRAFLPLGLAGVFGLLGAFGLPRPFDALTEPLVLVIVFALALVEGALDKFPALGGVFGVITVPLRILSGAVLFAATSGAGLDVSAAPELVAGGAIAGVVSVLAAVLRPSSSASAAGVSASFLSAFEDVVALVGAVIAIFVPLISLFLVAFVLFFFYRVRKRRGRKFEGLRILGD